MLVGVMGQRMLMARQRYALTPAGVGQQLSDLIEPIARIPVPDGVGAMLRETIDSLDVLAQKQPARPQHSPEPVGSSSASFPLLARERIDPERNPGPGNRLGELQACQSATGNGKTWRSSLPIGSPDLQAAHPCYRLQQLVPPGILPRSYKRNVAQVFRGKPFLRLIDGRIESLRKEVDDRRTGFLQRVDLNSVSGKASTGESGQSDDVRRQGRGRIEVPESRGSSSGQQPESFFTGGDRVPGAEQVIGCEPFGLPANPPGRQRAQPAAPAERIKHQGGMTEPGGGSGDRCLGPMVSTRPHDKDPHE